MGITTLIFALASPADLNEHNEHIRMKVESNNVFNKSTARDYHYNKTSLKMYKNVYNQKSMILLKKITISAHKVKRSHSTRH